MRIWGGLLFLVACLLIATPGFAEAPVDESKDAKKSEAKKEEKSDQKKDEVKDKVSVTKHAVKINGKEIKYTVTAGKLVMKDDEGKPKALVFFIAYTKNGVDDLSQRPIRLLLMAGRVHRAFGCIWECWGRGG